MKLDKRSITFALIVLMVGIELSISLMGMISPDTRFRWTVYEKFALYNGSPIYTYLTYALLHGGLFHLAMNMFIFAQMGPPCERAMGTERFVLFSALAAIACGAGTLFLTGLWRNQPILLVGYSGVIFAYIGVVFRMAIARAKDKRNAAIDLIKRNVLLIIFLVIPFVIPIPISGEAHLIGVIFGYIFAPYFLR